MVEHLVNLKKNLISAAVLIYFLVTGVDTMHTQKNSFSLLKLRTIKELMNYTNMKPLCKAVHGCKNATLAFSLICSVSLSKLTRETLVVCQFHSFSQNFGIS